MKISCKNCLHNGVCFRQEVTNDINEWIEEYGGCEHYKAKRGGKMPETRQTVFRQTKEEFEQLKNDAYEHKMNISDYLRYLVAKERKERESNG